MGSELGLTADSKAEIRFDSVGIWWVTWASVWTLLVFCGMAYLVARRDTQIVRVRGIGLSLSAVALLHLYWFSVQLGYVTGAVTPADVEYWIMGTYLPLGIALFHASNSRFLYVAKAQKRYLNRLDDQPASTKRSMGSFARFKNADYTSKMIIVVAVGMGLQVRFQLGQAE